MKDIQREVKALEVAMQVATDIQDKSYAYAVARIQEAILENHPTELGLKNTRDGRWRVFLQDPYSSCFGLVIVSPVGNQGHFLLPNYSNKTTTRTFVENFSSEDFQIHKSWKVVMPDSGAVYFRSGVDEIPLGVIPRDTAERRIISQFATYINNLCHGG